MFKHLSRLFSGVALSMYIAPALAQDPPADESEPVRRYTVEVIVFQYAENVGVGTEIFPPDEPELPIDEFDEFGEPVDPDGGDVPVFGDATTQVPDLDDAPDPEPVLGEDGIEELAEEDMEPLSRIDAILLLEEEFSMQRIRDRLSLLDVYEPVLHTAWTQIAPAKNDSEPLELSYFGPAPEGMSGTLTLYLGRFLHLVVDLELEERDEADVVDSDYDEPEFRFGDSRMGYDDNPFDVRSRVVYRINEDRIMRNEEVRYFDHPRFGVIAKVTRVEAPEPVEDLPLPLLPVGGQ